MIRLVLALVLALPLLAAPAIAQPLFTSGSAAQAQAHCPEDTVVWLNTEKDVYRMPGQKGYGRAKFSAYACRKEADAAGATLEKFKPAALAGSEPGGAQ